MSSCVISISSMIEINGSITEIYLSRETVQILYEQLNLYNRYKKGVM